MLGTVPHVSYHIRSIISDHTILTRTYVGIIVGFLQILRHLGSQICKKTMENPDPHRIPNHWDFGVKGPQGEKPNVEALGKRCELLPAIVGGPSGIGRQLSRANKVGWLILVSVCSSGTRQAMHFWGKLREARKLLSLMYRKATRLWCYLFMRGNGQSHEKMTALKLLE